MNGTLMYTSEKEEDKKHVTGQELCEEEWLGKKTWKQIEEAYAHEFGGVTDIPMQGFIFNISNNNNCTLVVHNRTDVCETHEAQVFKST